ncbi:hypothetical protein CFN78_18585 [Amycolatopsis antarctica]|uniref:Uncharacterized protein n=1 Tax=Amycolatopsis antarctica TaxID=1854586 RepID=A0A263D079_9PSEU|nr:hypothetical protein [Amycolatopsis antarctica]OZM71832.1 hypothetical protein CFN78_18585 [Amycolatopsis antarctica]
MADKDRSGRGEVPDDPRQDPRRTLDALEEKVFGETEDQRRTEKESGAAFEQDIDPQDTTADKGGHTAPEPPA